MKTTKSILLMVLLCYIALFAVLCMPIREQTKQEIIQEYQKHKEAFEYVKEYFIANDLSRIRRDNNKITILSDQCISLDDIDDELMIKHVHLLFDDLHYSEIFNSSSWDKSPMQLTFEKYTKLTILRKLYTAKTISRQ